jgi:tRNA threonylcarbamoyladenosine biosynthesis protein TsaB
MIQDVLNDVAINIDAVAGIAVCAGPGSYTGLRVGLSAAKGLAYVKDIPLMLFNRLDLLAWSLQKEIPIGIAMKARADEYFFASYNGAGEAIAVPQHIFAQDLIPYAQEGIHFITDDETFSISENKELTDLNHALNMDRWITKAEARFSASQFDDLAYSEPFYLKGAYTTQSKK